jgi:hypothetical protein
MRSALRVTRVISISWMTMTMTGNARLAAKTGAPHAVRLTAACCQDRIQKTIADFFSFFCPFKSAKAERQARGISVLRGRPAEVSVQTLKSNLKVIVLTTSK